MDLTLLSLSSKVFEFEFEFEVKFACQVRVTAGD